MKFSLSTKFKIFFLVFFPVLSIAQDLHFERKFDGILLVENNSPRYFYRISNADTLNPFARTNYVHPLYGNDGEILTEDFPEDHPHHHGIFWAWHQLVLNGKKVADPWLNENIKWIVSKTETKVEGKTAVLRAEIFWVIKSTSEKVIKENLSITFKGNTDSIFSMEFDIKLSALKKGIELGGSEDEKGYGGFSPRLKLPENVTFTSNKGKIEPQNLPLKSGAWIGISASNSSSGIVIMGEPDKLPNYQGWVLRSSKSMQNMAFPGRNPIRLRMGNPLHFRNQLLIYKDLNEKEIKLFYRLFRKE